MPSRHRRPVGPGSRVAPPLALLVALLVALLGPPLAAAPQGAAYDASSGDRSTARTAGAGPGVARFEVVSHNVERRPSAIDDALRRARRVGAPVVLLQEVCWWQARELRERHPRWTIGYKPDVDSPPCRREASLDDLQHRGRHDAGLVAIWTGGARGTVTAHTFRHQGARKFRHGAVCVHWRATDLTRRACSTHLVNAARFHQRRGTQVRQARELRRLTSPWVRRGDLVVLGGDFNARPYSRPMDFFYAVDGHGRFHEATGCPRTVDFCRRALSTTFDGGQLKIDYVFFSRNRLPLGAPHELRVSPTRSDHHLLSGWAHVDVVDG